MLNVNDLPRRGREGCVPIAFERQYTPAELAEIWKLHETTIIRMFRDRPGVLKIGKSNRRDGKRDYVTLRIPESVALKVHAERSN